MRSEEFLAADEQIGFIKFMFDATWEQIKKKRKEELERQEARKRTASTSKRTSIVRRNRSATKAGTDLSMNTTGRPQRNDSRNPSR